MATPTYSLPRLLSRLLDLLASDWLTLLFDLYRTLRRWLNRQRREGMYEILDYDATLELVDPKGKTAIFKKQQRVKFLQDEIISFPDYAWGEGEIFADYKCAPGVVVDRYQEGDRYNILISLRETKSAGDITDFYIERKVKHSFTKTEEWRQIEVRHLTRRLKIRIIFPLEIGDSGLIEVRANWTGTARTLSLNLDGPDQQTYRRLSGRSPLTLIYDVTSTDFRRGQAWQVSLVNANSQGGSAEGQVVISYPR